MRLIIKLSLVCAILAAVSGPGRAQEPTTPLTLRWVAPGATVLKEIVLDVEAVERLQQTTVATSTPWTEGTVRFSGPSIATLAALGPQRAVKATVTALNDYVNILTPSDWTEHGAILSVRMNGERMKIRDKGPFWVIFPIDSDPERFDTGRYHSRMVWQVKEVEFVVD